MDKLTRLASVLLLTFPSLGSAETATETHVLNLTHHWVGYFSLVVMVLGYFAAIGVHFLVNARFF